MNKSVRTAIRLIGHDPCASKDMLLPCSCVYHRSCRTSANSIRICRDPASQYQRRFQEERKTCLCLRSLRGSCRERRKALAAHSGASFIARQERRSMRSSVSGCYWSMKLLQRQRQHQCKRHANPQPTIPSPRLSKLREEPCPDRPTQICSPFHLILRTSGMIDTVNSLNVCTREAGETQMPTAW